MSTDQPALPASSVDAGAERAVGRALLDREHRFVEVDEALATMHGLPRAEHIGRSLDELLPDLAPAVSGLVAQVFSSGQPMVEVLLKGATAATRGAQRHWLASYYPVRSRGGTVVGVDVEMRPLSAPPRPAPPAGAGPDAAAALLDTVFDHAPTGLAFLDREYRYVRINQALAALNGASVEQHLGRSVRDLLPALAPQIEPIFAQVLATGVAAVDIELVEERAPAAGGRRVWRASYYPVRVAGGVIAGIGVVANDITARLQAEAALRASEARAAMLNEAVPAILYTAAPDGANEYMSQAYYAYTGATPGSGAGMGWEPMLHPDDAAVVAARWEAARASGAPFEGEFRLRRADGAYRWFRGRSRPIHDAAGRIANWFGIAVDIDDAKGAEAEREALLASERAARARAERTAAQLAQLQGVTAALAPVLTPAELATVVAERSAATLGAASSSVRMLAPDGASLVQIASVGLPAAVAERWGSVPLSAPFPIAQAVRTGEAFFIESRAALAPWAADLGATVDRLGYHAFVVVPLQVEGRAVGTLALTFDAPRAFDAEDRSFVLALAGQCAQALERARLYAAAQAAVEVRDSFIAVAAHDLRTPMTALLGQAQLLERRAAAEALSERATRSVRAIAQAADRLNRMISALLDLSRIQMGQVTIEPAPVELGGLLRRVAAELQPSLPAHPLVLEGADAPLAVSADELRLEQVLHNLIGNAVKYSPDGGAVRIGLERRRDRALIHVVDRGIGIGPEALPHLFERFYRAPGAARQVAGGLGVGLYVVRELVALHGGTVSVLSAEGAGSTFTVALPIE